MGGNRYVIMRHNQLRVTIADVMKEVCHDVQLEPQLITIKDVSSTADNARLDVLARGVWALFDSTFIDTFTALFIALFKSSLLLSST